jgi:hypothetical protein
MKDGCGSAPQDGVTTLRGQGTPTLNPEVCGRSGWNPDTPLWRDEEAPALGPVDL